MYKPDGCAGCPLAETGAGFVPGAVPDSPVLLVQGEAPGKTEVEQSTPFVGRAGHWVRENILRVAGFDPERVGFDNTLRCLPPVQKNGAAYPAAKVRDACETHCRQYDIWQQWPDVPLLLVGGNAARQRLGVEPITEWHGHIERLWRCEGCGRENRAAKACFSCGGKLLPGRWVGVTFHPAAVMRNPNLLPVVIAEVRNLRRAAEQRPVPRVIGGDWTVADLPLAPFVCDLEWNERSEVTVVGVALSSSVAFSTYAAARGLAAVRRRVEAGACIAGHNIIGADLPHIEAEPRSYRPEHVWDTMIVAHLLHPHLAGAAGTGDDKDTGVGLLGLGDQVRMYFGVENWKHDTSDLLRYNGLDCAHNFRLFEAQQQDIRATRQEHLIEKQQRLAVLARRMGEIGIRIDVPEARRIAAQQAERRAAAQAALPFNSNSPKQLLAWLAGRGVAVTDTRRETLERAALRFPGLPEWEALLGIKSDWKPLRTWFSEDALSSGRIAPRFHVTGTAVGRFSSSGPNAQNLPPKLRRLLLPPEGLRWIAFDYAQIENRIVAWVAGDKQALADYASGLDVHRLTASRIYGKQPELVTADERRFGKTVVHASGYGEKPASLAGRLQAMRRSSRKDIAEAVRLQGAYFNAYPALRAWHRALEAKAAAGNIQLRNPFGRWRCVYGQSPHEIMKRMAHFLGCSTAADLINGRALEIEAELGLVPALIVHDELVYAVPFGEEGDRLAARVREIMAAPVAELGGLVIPVESKTGGNYGKRSDDNPNGLVEQTV